MVSMHTSPAAQPGTGDAGGMNVALLSTALELAARGVEVDLIARAVIHPAAIDLAPGVTLHTLEAGRPGVLPKESLAEASDEFGEGVARLAGRTEPRYDLIHAHYWLSGIATLPVAIELGLPFVQSFHTLAAMKNNSLAPGDRPEEERRLRSESYLANQADAVVAGSSAEVSSLIDDVGAPQDRLWVIPPGVDIELFTPESAVSAAAVRRQLGLDPARAILTVVGRIQPLKAQDLAIRALAEVRGPRPQLVIVGEATPGAEDYRQSLDRLAESLGVAGDVHFVGSLGREKLAELLAATTLTLVPSYSETFGLVALESAASGTPVIGAATTGLTDSVAEGLSGFLLPSRSPLDWALEIEGLLDDGHRLARLSVTSREHAEKFTWAASATGLLGVYASLLG